MIIWIVFGVTGLLFAVLIDVVGQEGSRHIDDSQRGKFQCSRNGEGRRMRWKCFFLLPALLTTIIDRKHQSRIFHWIDIGLPRPYFEEPKRESA